MKTIAIHIQKGGVGKTTLSGNLAYALSASKKTILIDTDPQGNLSSWLLSSAPEFELCDILQGKSQLEDSIIKIKDNLFIIPTFALNGNLKSYAESKLNDEPFIFDDLKNEIEKLGFDYCVFDLSPGMSRLEKCVLLAVDEVITPLTPEFFSLDGIEIFTNELQKINKSYRKQVQHTKIVINAMNKSFKRHNLIFDRIKALDKYTLFTIGQDSKIAESQLQNQTIFQYQPENKTIPELNKLALAV